MELREDEVREGFRFGRGFACSGIWGYLHRQQMLPIPRHHAHLESINQTAPPPVRECVCIV